MDDPAGLAEAIADAVLAHPSVAGMDAGKLGTIATHLPGRRVSGVRVAEAGDRVEISVVLRLGARIPQQGEELRRLVRTIAGDVTVDVTVTDIVTADSPSTSDTARSGSKA
ncbi:hypothetical protein [Amycolatopsis anabasis]|uniref:hypothetical protein n=1 Tax=Amycolatopsis anabasis TaxID=1840409 RepID=UPI00131E222E|nr:hypothetical protein [Amycolatopsis anabasis]